MGTGIFLTQGTDPFPRWIFERFRARACAEEGGFPSLPWSSHTRGAHPGPHSGEAPRGDLPRPSHFGEITYSGFQKRAAAKTKGENKKPQKEGASELKPAISRRIKKTHGAQNGTRRKHQKQGRTAKMGHKPTATGQKEKRKRPQQTRVGVSCYYSDICLLKRTTTTTYLKERERERTKPETENLTWTDFFRTVSGAKRQNIKQKLRQNTTAKTQDQHRHPKTKICSRRFIPNSDPKKWRAAKNGKGHWTKRKKKITDTIYPLGEPPPDTLWQYGCRVQSSPTPFLGFPLQHSAGRGWGGGETSSGRGSLVLTHSPQTNKHDDSLLPPRPTPHFQ